MKAADIVYGKHAVNAVLKRSPERVTKLLLQHGKHDQRLNDFLLLAQAEHIFVDTVSQQELDDVTHQANHQGVVAVCQPTHHYRENDIEVLIDKSEATPLILLLDGVQDPHNLGACLRSADALGAIMVIAPKNRSVGLTPVVRKVASGAAETLPFIQVTNLARTMGSLQKLGIWIYGLAAEAQATLAETDLKGPAALVLGAEGSGLRRLTRDKCDALIQIPMQGYVSSLNVSVATGICLYEVTRQRMK